jgi:mannosyltransferase OCH1-like enzyme
VRTVHFTWKDNDPPPAVFPPWWRQSWLTAGWQARLWTDRDIENFAETQSPEIRSMMEAYPCGVMRSDAFRYLILKRLGGLYVDLDFVNLSPLDWIEKIDRFACADQGDGQLCNAFLWAPHPNDPFFDGIEESLLSRVEERNPVSATGPRFLTAHAAGKSFHQIPGKWVYPVAWDNPDEIAHARTLGPEALKRRYPEARAIHIWSSSWFVQCEPSNGADNGRAPSGRCLSP